MFQELLRNASFQRFAGHSVSHVVSLSFPSCFPFSLPSLQGPLSFSHHIIKVVLRSPLLAGTSPLGCVQYCIKLVWRDGTASPYHLKSSHLCRTHVFIHHSRPSRSSSYGAVGLTFIHGSPHRSVKNTVLVSRSAEIIPDFILYLRHGCRFRQTR